MSNIFKRKNLLPRPSIANIDLLALVIPLEAPEPDLYVLDKMLVIAENQDIDVKIIFTKYDLNKELGEKLKNIYENIPYDVYLSYPGNEKLLNYFREDFQDKLVCLAGPSGAGKSTLLNAITGKELMEVGAVSKKTQRGKQTTRHVELFSFNSGYICDTPGFSSLSFEQAHIDAYDLEYGYKEIWEASQYCQFSSCKHIKEPKCAVKDSEDIDPGRLKRYQDARIKIDSSDKYGRRKN